MRRPYELTFIVRINTSAEVMDEQVQQVQAWLVADDQGRILREDIWGRRKLAYEIDHLNEGYYVHYLVELETSALAELEQNLKLAPDILRYLIVRGEAPKDANTASEAPADADTANEATTAVESAAE